jgi:hypothetical protein
MGTQLDDQTLVDFTRRWFALWTEADPHARSTQVADLWANNGAQVLVDPPPAMREAATELACPVPRLEVRGHDEIDRRVTQAYTMFIEPRRIHIQGDRRRCRSSGTRSRRVGMGHGHDR